MKTSKVFGCSKKGASCPSTVVEGRNAFFLLAAGVWAKTLGATRTVNAKSEKLEDVMKELGMHEGFDVGLEMSGASACLNQMIETMNCGGRIALLGIQGAETKVNWNHIVWKGLKIKGIYGREMWETWYKMSAMIQGGLDISKIITHRYHYTDFEKGFQDMIGGKSGKVILDWEK